MSTRFLDSLPSTNNLKWPRREDLVDFSPPDSQTSAATNHNADSPFLRLPRELRDQIYTHFLSPHRPAPPSPPFAGPRIYRLSPSNDPLKDIAYPLTLPPSPLHALLRTSRATRADILSLASHRNASHASLPASLDLMANSYTLYPLWTSLPALPSRHTSLDVTVDIRVFTPEAFGPHGTAFRVLLTLLGQLFCAGPGFATSAPGPAAEPEWAVGTLALVLRNFDIYTPRAFGPAVREVVRGCEGLVEGRVLEGRVGRVRVVVEDPEGRVEGLEGREWEWEIRREADWEEDRGLEVEGARFRVKGERG